jgi:hypothetical protein
MSELKRLRDQGSDRVARLLLDAGHFDEPPKKRLDRIVAGIVGAGAAAGAKTAVASGALAAVPAAAKAVTPLVLVFKWLGAGVLAGLVVSGGAATLQPYVLATDSPGGVLLPSSAKRDPETTRMSWRSLEPVQQQGRVDLAASKAGAAAPASAPSAGELPSTAGGSRVAAPSLPQRAQVLESDRTPLAEPAGATGKGVAPQGAMKPASPGTGPGPSHVLREELAALTFAKSALNRGAPRAALDAVRAYRMRFRAGALAREATYIEMEAEHALGNRGRAVELAGELAPGVTPNAERAREILKGE